MSGAILTMMSVVFGILRWSASDEMALRLRWQDVAAAILLYAALWLFPAGDIVYPVELVIVPGYSKGAARAIGGGRHGAVHSAATLSAARTNPTLAPRVRASAEEGLGPPKGLYRLKPPGGASDRRAKRSRRIGLRRAGRHRTEPDHL